jgi:predicted metal-dependent HD superfamily phosphohydrolase
MNDQHIVTKVKEFVEGVFAAKSNEMLLYHNIEHTKYVVKAAEQISDHYKLNKKDALVLQVAAWFHDVGYLDGPVNHEAAGAQAARTYMMREGIEDDLIDRTAALIMATEVNHLPANLLEEIICDADLFHLGKKSFEKKSDQLRHERALLEQRSISKKEWMTGTIAFMQGHHYYTEYARTLLNNTKAENLRDLKQKLADHEHDIVAIAGHITGKENAEPVHDKNKPEKGIETMFRITSSNNQRLSDMADNKAHILITVNSIILSAIISLLLRKLEDNSFLAYPTFILLAVGLVSMTFSILATRPSIPSGLFTPEDVEAKKVNLLFFGNFYGMSIEAYTEGMMKVMDDHDFLYLTLIRDVYGQGVVLGKKYKLLRAAYNIFMYGMIISVLAFIAVSAFHHDVPKPLPTPVKMR